ncbi:septum formation protein [Parabacteroides sp. PFB2-12]|uniref:Maf-like protein n=1 Tax=unclassified Parabacteroides TaxID=2649774 RepID=UPI0024741EDE|nr:MULTISPECIES: Maf-like protein [unclassified Parabacteroides]MDH6342619.1 septum formation protein [Parabacteroides sp. PM6-13]MDH6391747.1 septum formation protein [Parabacteroides sp. PFB2-12]
MNLLPNLSKYKIILASNSPRRKELLGGLNLDFEVRIIPDIDESYPEEMPVEAIAGYVAQKKAEAYLPTLADEELLITADTIVSLGGKILGKPTDREDAIRMLGELSGRQHEVITGVCVYTREKQLTFSVTSAVRFGTLTEEEITYYVDNYRPYDKAGAYGIQEWIGYIAVEAIQGSFYNVMGLPIQRLYQELKNF